MTPFWKEERWAITYIKLEEIHIFRGGPPYTLKTTLGKPYNLMAQVFSALEWQMFGI